MTRSMTGRRVTAADVAREAGVSRATVGFVLNSTLGQTISEGTTQRVLEAAKRLGYRPHPAAQALASGRTRIILLVLPDWPVEYSLRRYIDEASGFLDEAGYSLVTMTIREGSKARPLWETLRPDVVMGMLPFSEQTFRDIRSAGVASVIPGPDDAATTTQSPASLGPRLQVEHLAERGRGRLVFAATADHRLEALQSARYALAATTAEGLGLPRLLRYEVDRDNAGALVKDWRRDRVDGVVAYNDDVAALVIGAALRGGLRIPEDLAVVGHDDSPIAEVFVPSLTSVHMDNAGLGRYFADLALSAANGTDWPAWQPSTKVSLAVRESS